MRIFYSSNYTIAAHSFETTRKSGWIAESLGREPIAGIELVASEPTNASALSRVHDPGYVDAVRNGNPRELAESQGFHWDPGLWEMVCALNGGVIAAAIDALRTSRVSGSLSSGLHHARRARGAGFCTFNGLVLAAGAALDAGARTVLILDLDAHCGGGTHELIHGDERIWQMDVSVDAFDQYEPLGNNQLEMVHDSSRYLPTIERKLTWLEREAPRFDICLYNAGMDPFGGCSIGAGCRGSRKRFSATVRKPCSHGVGCGTFPSHSSLRGDTSGRSSTAQGSSRSTGSRSKQRALRMTDAPWLGLSHWKPSTKDGLVR